MKRALVLILALGLGTGSAVASQPPLGETTLWTRVPDPGNPEGIAVRKGVVYIGSHTPASGNSDEGPSRIFRFRSSNGKLLGSTKIKGQNKDATHGILAMEFDRSGRLYVLDRNPSRMLRFNKSLLKQKTYARFPDLHPCSSAEEGEPCSPTESDQAPFPDYFAFDPRGNAYVTDLEAATIFKVPSGGGKAKVWFQDARLDSVFGPNGIVLDQSRSHLYFAMTGSLEPTEPAQGIIYRLPLVPKPTADDLQTFFTYVEPAAGPDGIAFGRSGKLYVALAGSNQVSVLNPDGSEEIRFPATPADNEQQEVPYDLPASLAFDGKGYLLVTNQSFFADNVDNQVVLSAWVDDKALPLVRPRVR